MQVTSLYGLPPDFLLEFCRNIRCPHLLVKVLSDALVLLGMVQKITVPPELFSGLSEKQTMSNPSISDVISVQAQSQGWDTEELNRAAVEAYCTNQLYEYRAVPGPHHVHLNNPEIVAAPIATFLERHNNLDGTATATSTDVKTDL